MKYEVVLTMKINEVVSGLSSRTDMLLTRVTFCVVLLIVVFLVLIKELVFHFNLCLRILFARAGITCASSVSETSACEREQYSYKIYLRIYLRIYYNFSLILVYVRLLSKNYLENTIFFLYLSF